MVLSFTRKALVIGGAGALGREVVSALRTNWEVTNIDRSSIDTNANIILRPEETREQHLATIAKRVEGKYGAILCFAGGFTMGPASSPDVFEQCEQMMKVNLYPSLLAAHLAAKHLDDSGLLLFTGAATPFKSAAPGLLAYAMAKNTVHSLALNMAARSDISSVATVLTILPTMIDTPANRKAMPDADMSTWASPQSIAKLVKMWADGKNCPENGSFLVLKGEKGAVVPEFV